MKKTVHNRWIACAAVIAMLGMCYFCTLIAIAIRDYRGPTGESYAITEQYLSELGMHNSNVRHHFNRGLIALGFTLIPFFTLIPGSDTKESVWLKLIGLAGAIGAVGLIGLGAFPADEGLHRVMLAMWAIPTPLMIVGFLSAISKSKARAVFISCRWGALAIAVTLLVLFFRGDIVVLQKIAVATSLVWFPLVAWFVIRSAIRVVVIQRSIEDDANKYITVIARRHRLNREKR